LKAFKKPLRFPINKRGLPHCIRYLIDHLRLINSLTIGKLPYNFLITSLKGGVDFEFLLLLKTLQELAVIMDGRSVLKILFKNTFMFLLKKGLNK